MARRRAAALAKFWPLLRSLGWKGNDPPRVARMGFEPATTRFGDVKEAQETIPLVTLRPLSESEPLEALPKTADYIAWVSQATLASLRDESLFATPPLLFLLLRRGMLLTYYRTALDLLIEAGLATDNDRREPELVDIPLPSKTGSVPPAWSRFDASVPTRDGPRHVREVLESGIEPYAAHSNTYRNVLVQLSRLKLSTAELERLLTETLDTFSHRLDAWITSLATQRLSSLRALGKRRSEGCHLGAYAWLEDLRFQRERPPTGGVVEAPSLAQAATAAVLRNGFLTRVAEKQSGFEFNLSSARVRAGQEILYRVRAGQPLGVVLGLQLERALQGRVDAPWIDKLRARYLLSSTSNDASGKPNGLPRNVIDGLKLWQASSFGTDPIAALANLGIPEAVKKQIAEAITALSAGLDAVSDLLVAEGVHQLLQGNPGASAASVDSLGRGVRAPALQVTSGPRGGTELTHRVIVPMTDESIPSGWLRNGTVSGPRAAAEPRLEAFVGRTLGPPEDICCRVLAPPRSLHNPAEHIIVEVSLADLNLGALDFLALVGEGDHSDELELRIRDAALMKQAIGTLTPSVHRAELEIDFERCGVHRSRNARTFPEAQEIARTLRSILSDRPALMPRHLVLAEAGAQEARIDDEIRDRIAGATRALDAALRSISAAISLAETSRKESEHGNGSESAAVLDALNEALRGAAPVFLPGAYPEAEDAQTLLAQTRRVKSELERRLSSLGELDDANPLRAERVFEGGFRLLPTFFPTPSQSAELALAAAASSTLADGDVRAPWRWLQQCAMVRSSLQRWRKLRIYGQSLGTSFVLPSVLQLPYESNAHWAALRKRTPKEQRSGVLSLVFDGGRAPSEGQAWAGIVLDAWSETIPGDTVQTGIACHYDDPGAEAGQALLLAVPPDPAARTWDAETLLDIVGETLDLAKIRTVDGEMLGELSQLLPTLIVAENSTPGDAISTGIVGHRIADA